MLRYRVRSRRVWGWTIVAPTALAAVLAVGYLIWSPPSQDLSAATFRADLFADHGFVLWNNDWYSGHHVLSYSVLYPPLAALLGAGRGRARSRRRGGCLRRAGARPLRRPGAGPGPVVAAGAASWLLTGRMAFLLALPWASERCSPPTAAARRSGRCSPRSGASRALSRACSSAWPGWRSGSPASAPAARLALGAVVPIVVLNLAFRSAARSRSSSMPSSRCPCSPWRCSGWFRSSTGRCGSACCSTRPWRWPCS